ncbi:MAG: EamA family transporter [Prevotella sp.]|nr:EamA family transporter [Candidatus Equicola stercoris]
MWLILALISAILLGFYDVFKKISLKTNAVIPVLCLNTLFSSILLLPFFFLSNEGIIPSYSILYTEPFILEEQLYYVLKAVIVMSSWICGYLGIKHLPITIVGPINATRPVMVLIGALTLLGEHLNLWQWVGITIAVISFVLLSQSGKKEGIDFKRNKWIICVILANVFGAIAGLYDRWLLSPDGKDCDQVSVQLWNNVWQWVMLSVIYLIQRYRNRRYTRQPLDWKWSILMISICLTIADFAYFWALSHAEAMISIVSMIRRSSVVVSFIFGAMIFQEKNLKSKIFDLLLVLLSMLFLYFGSK